MKTPKPERALVCAFGEPLEGEHPLCEAYLHQLAEQYHADVAAGKYDSEGYTVKDRRQQQKKATA